MGSFLTLNFNTMAEDKKGGLAMLMGMAPEKEESDYKVKFTPPQGLVIPDDKKAGESFEVVAKVKMEEGGKLCLEALNGISLEPNSEEEVAEEVPVEEEVVAPEAPASLEQAMTEQRMGKQY